MGKKVTCPECGVEYNAPDDVMIREILTCPDCGLEVEITSVEGEKLGCRKIVMEKEDWGE